MNMHHKHTQTRYLLVRGFTMIELMVVVAIIAILVAIAAPNFSTSIKRYRVNAIQDEINASLQLARITAMSQGFTVFLARNPACNGVTLTGTDDWSCGWRVIVDKNRNGNVNTTVNVGDPNPLSKDTLLQTTLVPVGYSIAHNGTGASNVSINQWGQLSGTGHNFIITSAPYGTNDPTTAMCITSGGRVKYLKDVLSCP